MGEATTKASVEDTRLGTILLETGIVTERDLRRCLELQELTAGRWPLGEILVEQGVISRAVLEELLGVQLALRRAAQAVCDIDAAVANDGGDYLLAAIRLGANDLFLSEGRVPYARVAGDLLPLSEQPLAGPEIWQIVREHMGIDVLERIAEHHSVTMPLDAAIGARGRITAFRQFDGLTISVRLHPSAVRTPEEARLHPSLVECMRTGRGMVLVAGDSGSGLTEVLASLLQVATAEPERAVHVLDRTFEYPVSRDAAIVTCRCIGEHTVDWQSGVRAALREEPDVLFVSEVEADSFDLLVHAAESGTLVVAGVRAKSTLHALEKVIGFRPQHDESRVRGALAAALLAVMSVRTVPNTEHTGLELATEVLLLDDGVRDLVRAGSLQRIRSLLRIDGRGHGLDASLLRLVNENRIRFEDAFTFAIEKSWLLEAQRAPTGGTE